MIDRLQTGKILELMFSLEVPGERKHFVWALYFVNLLCSSTRLLVFRVEVSNLLPSVSISIFVILHVQLMFQKQVYSYGPNNHFPTTRVIIVSWIQPKIAHHILFQMPYLDEWSTVAEDYSHSLSGVTDALLNLSLRLPISGGVKVRCAVAYPYNYNMWL